MQKQDVLMDARWDAAFKYPSHRADLKIFRMFGYIYNYTEHKWEKKFVPGIYTVAHVNIGYYGPFGAAACTVEEHPPPPSEDFKKGYLSFKASSALFKKFWIDNQEAVTLLK